jgi:hypothetical protein
MDLEQFLSFKNWHHLGKLSFFSCDWFNDDDWKALVKHADNFKNLEWLNLGNIFLSIFSCQQSQFNKRRRHRKVQVLGLD